MMMTARFSKQIIASDDDTTLPHLIVPLLA
jgi:hypothetical protein